ncbi:hypothetical protein BDA96_10G013800 [Sorghum bicolor]|uniref:Uncharacterized protein n=1 Tax=Sorghum bicolor TaxID=4558 RepID=A0A921PXU4_SORBI|nr:hypothetical protein BDA96_10G013800 [Sorghum bicolor]
MMALQFTSTVQNMLYRVVPKYHATGHSSPSLSSTSTCNLQSEDVGYSMQLQLCHR